jgi:nitroimidazol reductase NimA-like FMN-containing flavoprotein (pyridoxamine 5'-phosphate oxidase superfamily)
MEDTMRRKDREVTDINEILKIVDKAKILHLGLFDGEYPYIVPLHYGYEYKNGNLIFYMHGAKEGHKLELIRNNPNVCIELECDIELLSGDDIPCKYSSTFASVIGKGYAEILEDEQEKIAGLKLLMKNQTGREFQIDERMAESVAVIKVTVSSFTAKSNSMAK